MSKKLENKIIWLTGLSGSGKTTISKKLHWDFFRKKTKNIKDFSRKIITRNNNFIINKLKSSYKKYDYSIISLISPLRATRFKAKKFFGKNYFEFYINCGIKELIKRDTKGLYKLAKEKKIKNLIGYKSKINYEKSKYKAISINTKKLDLNKSVRKIINAIKWIMNKFNWKKKTAILIGRFQPFHDGHKKIFLNALKKNKQVCILVMDSYKFNKKNPFKFSYVKRKIDSYLKNYKNKYILIKIPVVSEVVYGRKVGYKIRKIKLNREIESISATKIRLKMRK